MYTSGERSVCLPGIEAPPISCTALPLAAVPGFLFRLDVEVVDVVHQVLQRVEQQVALQAREEESESSETPTESSGLSTKLCKLSLNIPELCTTSSDGFVHLLDHLSCCSQSQLIRWARGRVYPCLNARPDMSRQTTNHTSQLQFTVSFKTELHVFGMCQETGVPGGNQPSETPK